MDAETKAIIDSIAEFHPPAAWTDAYVRLRNKVAIELRKRGLTFREIGDLFNVTDSTIAQGIYRDAPHMAQARLHPNQVPASPQRDSAIVRLRRQRVTIAAIGKQFGLTPGAVRAALERTAPGLSQSIRADRRAERHAYLRNVQPRNNDHARRITELAIKAGLLSRPSRCMSCGSDARLDAHHSDYTKPLEIAWLCNPCHRAEHRRIRAEKRAARA